MHGLHSGVSKESYNTLMAILLPCNLDISPPGGGGGGGGGGICPPPSNIDISPQRYLYLNALYVTCSRC